jgi:hypothetical protein
VRVERGLIVKEIDVGETTALKEAEDALSAGLEVGQAGLAASGGGEGLRE